MIKNAWVTSLGWRAGEYSEVPGWGEEWAGGRGQGEGRAGVNVPEEKPAYVSGSVVSTRREHVHGVNFYLFIFCFCFLLL